MGALANVVITNTFLTWLTRTNQALVRLNAYAISESSLFANTLTANVAFNIKTGANANFVGTGTVLNLKQTKLGNTTTLIGGARLLGGHSTTAGSNPADIIMKNPGMYRFLRNAIATAANFGLGANTGLNGNSDSLRMFVPSANGEMQFYWAGATLGGWIKLENAGMGLLFNAVSTADHSQPASGRVEIYTKNNADGTPMVRVRFNTGTPRTIASPTGAIGLPSGNTFQRPSDAANGDIRFNSQLNKFEGFRNSAWSTVGGGATGGGTDEVFIENGLTVTSNYTITSGKSAVSTGPITINPGITVTIPSGSRWVIL